MKAPLTWTSGAQANVWTYPDDGGEPIIEKGVIVDASGMWTRGLILVAMGGPPGPRAWKRTSMVTRVVPLRVGIND